MHQKQFAPYGAPPTSGQGPIPSQGFTPIGSDRVADILEQVKNDYASIEADYSNCKRERDEFERKCRYQLSSSLSLSFNNQLTHNSHV
jgi:hypothetical protein